jgi:hypothetical protein
MKTLRSLLLLCTTGFVWYFLLQLFFVWSGAQSILGNPQHQSAKFIAAFTQQPLPRMANTSFLYRGFFVVGLFVAVAFLIANAFIKDTWWKTGLVFGLLHWLLMIPWFEFYLPYNVMLEPLPLVLFEGVLWLALTLTLGLYMSFVASFRK